MHSSLKLFPIVLAILAALFAYRYPDIFSDSKFDFIPKQQSTPTARQVESSASTLTADMSVSRQVIKKVLAVETSEVSLYGGV